MMKKFFILMIISCILLVGCGSTTEEKTTSVPKCGVCQQSSTSFDWEIVSVSEHAGNSSYWYKCRYCGNIIRVDRPIIKECYQK